MHNNLILDTCLFATRISCEEDRILYCLVYEYERSGRFWVVSNSHEHKEKLTHQIDRWLERYIDLFSVDRSGYKFLTWLSQDNRK